MEKKGNSLLLIIALGGAALWYLSKKKDEDEKAKSSLSDGGEEFPILGCMDPNAVNYSPVANTDSGNCDFGTQGCTNPLATNYNPNATVNDGSCEGIIAGCMDPTATQDTYNPDANVSVPEMCSYIIDIEGCTNELADNYNEDATINDGSCIIAGCTDPLSSNYNIDANVDDGSCNLIIQGCTDSLACNYNQDANQDAGNCWYAEDVYGPGKDCGGDCVDDIDGDGICDAEDIYPGCTDPSAVTWDPEATNDDGSCLYVDDVTGCKDPQANNYDENLLYNDVSQCTYDPIYGCTDDTALNYNPMADADDGSCEAQVVGCMNPVANNYNPQANVSDNNQCIFDEPSGGFTAEEIKVWNYMTAEVLANNGNSSADFYDYVSPAYGGEEMPMFWIAALNPPTVPPSEWSASDCTNQSGGILACITNDWGYWTEAYLNSL